MTLNLNPKGKKVAGTPRAWLLSGLGRLGFGVWLGSMSASAFWKNTTTHRLKQLHADSMFLSSVMDHMSNQRIGLEILPSAFFLRHLMRKHLDRRDIAKGLQATGITSACLVHVCMYTRKTGEALPYHICVSKEQKRKIPAAGGACLRAPPQTGLGC